MIKLHVLKHLLSYFIQVLYYFKQAGLQYYFKTTEAVATQLTDTRDTRP